MHVFRTMKPEEADIVAHMVRQLPVDMGYETVPLTTGQTLLENSDLVRVTVAELAESIVACCTWYIIFSSWRAAKGIYICDLFVASEHRSAGLGQRLMRAAAREAAKHGAKFIKLETSIANPRPGEFYSRLKFHTSKDDKVMFLEPDEFIAFLQGDE